MVGSWGKISEKENRNWKAINLDIVDLFNTILQEKEKLGSFLEN